MNAFLAVRIPKLPVNSIEDIISEDFGILMWEQGFMESYLKKLPETSSMRQMYDKSKERGHNMYIKVIKVLLMLFCAIKTNSFAVGPSRSGEIGE